MHHQSAQIPASRTTPLWAVLVFTFLCSIGSGIIYGGVFFLAKSRYHFTARDNFLLALLFGIAYIPGAMGAGRLQRALTRFHISPRSILMAIMVLMGAACFLPRLVDYLHAGSDSAWPLWTTIAIYSPLSGMMWPIVESFLAGGRTERQLRAATGRFNVVWSGSIVVTMFAIAPCVERAPLLIIFALGILHLLCIAIVVRFQPSPAAHEHHTHCRSCGYDLSSAGIERCPECGTLRPTEKPLAYHQLLAFLRTLLPVSFMFNSTLSPYMPTALESLGVAAAWQTPVAATWYSARVLTFLAMERWHGWHGRWTTPIAGALLLLLSFGWVVLTPRLAPGGLGLALFLSGLAAFGVGVGIIYAAALYYAMEVGSSGVDAGGTHEALIGLGYTAGPICGLIGIAAVPASNRTHASDLVTVAIVSGIASLVGAIALVRAVKVAKSSPQGPIQT